MTTIKFVITDGNNTEWRDVDPTDIIVVDLSFYNKSRDLIDIDISNEGKLLAAEIANLKIAGQETIDFTEPRKPWDFGSPFTLK